MAKLRASLHHPGGGHAERKEGTAICPGGRSPIKGIAAAELGKETQLVADPYRDPSVAAAASLASKARAPDRELAME